MLFNQSHSVRQNLRAAVRATIAVTIGRKYPVQFILPDRNGRTFRSSRRARRTIQLFLSGFRGRPNGIVVVAALVCSLVLANSVQAATQLQETSPVPSVLVLSNSIEPAADPGRFNLLIDDEIVAGNVGNGFTAEPVLLAEGEHEIAVTAFADTSLALYETTILCVDVNNVVLVNQIATNVTLELNDDSRVECVIRHVRLPELSAVMRDKLHVDADIDDSPGPSPGDTLLFEVTITGLSGSTATGVELTVPIDANTQIVANKVSTSQGTIKRGLDEDDSFVQVLIGELRSSTSVSVTFQVRIHNPLPKDVHLVRFQGEVISNETEAILTDDPSIPGVSQPNEIGITARPLIKLSQRCLNLVDADSNGFVSGGDTLFCQVLVLNIGNTEATNLELRGELDTRHAPLIAGTLTTSASPSIRTNETESGTEVRTTISSLASDDTSITLSYMLRINSNVSEPSLTNQFFVVADVGEQSENILASVSSVIAILLSNHALYLPLISWLIPVR